MSPAVRLWPGPTASGASMKTLFFLFARQPFAFSSPRLGRGGRGRDTIFGLFLRGALLCFFCLGEGRPLWATRALRCFLRLGSRLRFCSSARTGPCRDGSTPMFFHVLGQPLRRRCGSPFPARRSPSGRLEALWGYHEVSVFLCSGRGLPLFFIFAGPRERDFLYSNHSVRCVSSH